MFGREKKVLRFLCPSTQPKKDFSLPKSNFLHGVKNLIYTQRKNLINSHFTNPPQYLFKRLANFRKFTHPWKRSFVNKSGNKFVLTAATLLICQDVVCFWHLIKFFFCVRIESNLLKTSHLAGTWWLPLLYFTKHLIHFNRKQVKIQCLAQFFFLFFFFFNRSKAKFLYSQISNNVRGFKVW